MLGVHKKRAAVALGLGFILVVALAVGIVLSTSPKRHNSSGITGVPVLSSSQLAVQKRGLEVVLNRGCSASQLTQITASTPVLSTILSDEMPKGCSVSIIQVSLGTLLILEIPEANTNILGITRGCLVRSRSSVQEGQIRAAFFLDKIGRGVIMVANRQMTAASVFYARHIDVVS